LPSDVFSTLRVSLTLGGNAEGDGWWRTVQVDDLRGSFCPIALRDPWREASKDFALGCLDGSRASITASRGAKPSQISAWALPLAVITAYNSKVSTSYP
jgi:hypothetical protein